MLISSYLTVFSENYLDERGRRGFAVVELWKDALTLLFKGARKLGIDKGGYQVFEKQGLYNNALGDFIAAKPRGVRTQVTEDREKITGMIGDNKLQLISQRSDRGTKYNPTLQIIDKKTERPLYKFVYKVNLQ